MFGNVSEWCLEFETQTGNNLAAKLGGSWKAQFKTGDLWAASITRDIDVGFRIVMMNS
jgi:hypothetical protein